MTKSKRKRITIGAIVAISGLLLVIFSTGMFSTSASATLLSTTGNMGISMTTSMPIVKNYPLLASVGPGGTYEWQVSVTNTGIAWDDAWFCVRVLKTTSTPVLISNPNYGGAQMYVGQCSAGTDNIQCRENIESSTGWDMKYRISPTGSFIDISDTTMGDQVFCPSMGPLASGATKSWNFQLSVPTGVSMGGFPVLATSGANVANIGWIIASKYDTLTVGAVSGDFTFLFIGGLMLSIGTLAVFGIRPF